MTRSSESTARCEATDSSRAESGPRRHRARLASQRRLRISSAERLILLVPSWRPDAQERIAGKHFLDSRRARAWRSLVRSDELHSLAERLRCMVRVATDATIEVHRGWLGAPADVEVVTSPVGSTLLGSFPESSVVLTDSYPVASELGVREGAVGYFDALTGSALGGGNGCQESGSAPAGPLCQTEEEALNAVERLLKRASAVSKPSSPLSVPLAFRGGSEVLRIASLDAATSEGGVEAGEQAQCALIEAAERASEAQEWGLAVRRWRLVLALPPSRRPHHAASYLATALNQLR